MNTEIRIPGKEVQTLEGMTMSVTDVISAYSGRIDLSAYEATSTVVGDTTVIEFKNRTGTKGNARMDALFNVISQALLDASVDDTEEDEEEDEEYEEDDVEVSNTEIRIPGREVQVIRGMVLSSAQVISNYSGRIDLNAFTSNTYVSGDTQVVEFTQRSGTKG